jgi:Family of unknown function (DUF6522)
MSEVSIAEGGFVVDAQVLGAAFDLAPESVPERLRAGEITSGCETGVDEDAGRWRLTFFHAGRALRLTVDAQGTVLSRESYEIR